MKILISGAGIAGLSLALRLHQHGLAPVVIERSAALRDGGYMLALSDPGYDAAERMGIAEALRAAQYLPKRMVYIGANGQEKFALEGRAPGLLTADRQLSLMRGDIERILYEHLRDHVEFRFGASVTALQPLANGICARMNDGTTIEADLAVGADGLHSNLRALAFGPEERFIRFLGGASPHSSSIDRQFRGSPRARTRDSDTGGNGQRPMPPVSEARPVLMALPKKVAPARHMPP